MKLMINEPCSFLGSPIFKTESARINEARRFFRVAQNLALGRKGTLQKFARYIRYGLLSVSDAEQILLGRLSLEKLRRYQLAKYWISSGFDSEQSFYFNPSQLWQKEVVEKVENITLFP